MSVIESLLAGLIDYAGLYPPANLDMRSAVKNYLCYRQSKYARALGRFIVDLGRINEVRSVAGDAIRNLKLSVIAAPDTDCERISALLDEDVAIEAIEFKAASTSDVDRIRNGVPHKLEAYIELPIDSRPEVLEAVSHVGARVKLRMGGVVAEAFPSAEAVARMLAVFHRHRLAFKATAGLHHPVRSRHNFTYKDDSPAGFMHGFINLLCAAALIHFDDKAGEAVQILDEQDPGTFRLTRQAVSWRSHSWSAEQLTETRRDFFISFGSCSFEEPIRDLEALGWL